MSRAEWVLASLPIAGAAAGMFVGGPAGLLIGHLLGFVPMFVYVLFM
jgi:hypothetical protein